MLEAIKMEFWRRAADKSRLERIINERIKRYVYSSGRDKEQITHMIRTCPENGRNTNPKANYQQETCRKKKTGQAENLAGKDWIRLWSKESSETVHGERDRQTSENVERCKPINNKIM